MLLRVLLTGVLVAGVLSGFVQGSTVAQLTAEGESGGNQFVVGSVSLAAGLSANDSLSVSDLVPGDSFVAGLILENTGSLPVWYSMTAVVNGSSFGNALVLTARVKTPNPCSSVDGAVIAGPLPLAESLFGSPEMGYDPGDRVLRAGAAEVLCFQVQLPADASPALQGTSTTADFTFLASQQ